MSSDGRRYLPRETRRTQLLELGLRLFATRAYDEVSIDDIAREAGISRGLLYHYFSGKRTLYLEVIRYAAERLLEALAPDPRFDPAANLQRGLERYLDFAEAHADAYLALMHGGLGADELVQQVLEETRRAVVADIVTGLGVAAPAPAALRLAARSWLGAVEAAALEWLAQREVARPALVAMLAASLATQLVVAARLCPGLELPEGLHQGLAAMLSDGGRASDG